MGNLFGTDGIRGKAGEYPMTEELVSKAGWAIASIFSHGKINSKILIGRDTRESGERFEKALISGIRKATCKVKRAGIIPTPGVSYIVSSRDFDAGIVISASHNPYDDNGIKVFDKNGCKLSDEKEAEIETRILNDAVPVIHLSENTVSDDHEYENTDDYIAFLKQCLDQSVSVKEFRLVVDCANGSTYQTAPQLFSDLGTEVETLFIAPNGKNINENCGSEHPDEMRQNVIQKKADIGFSFDGDGDRLVVADETGDILTGDRILAICAAFLKKRGKLNNNKVVSTIMSNIGLSTALRNLDVEHIITDVGDRYVSEKMRDTGAILGGEDSGHIIFMDHQNTGDGLVTALKLLEVMKTEGKPLSELKKIMTVYPQTLMNVQIKSKPKLEDFPEIINTIKAIKNNLGKEGRVVVRYSGTQPICRIMIEGPNKEDINSHCRQLSEIIQKYIG